MLAINGTKAIPNLNAARVAKFQLKVASSVGFVPPEKLLPAMQPFITAIGHYHQVQVWRAVIISHLKNSESVVRPNHMTKSAATGKIYFNHQMFLYT